MHRNVGISETRRGQLGRTAQLIGVVFILLASLVAGMSIGASPADAAGPGDVEPSSPYGPPNDPTDPYTSHLDPRLDAYYDSDWGLRTIERYRNWLNEKNRELIDRWHEERNTIRTLLDMATDPRIAPGAAETIMDIVDELMKQHEQTSSLLDPLARVNNAFDNRVNSVASNRDQVQIRGYARAMHEATEALAEALGSYTGSVNLVDARMIYEMEGATARLGRRILDTVPRSCYVGDTNTLKSTCRGYQAYVNTGHEILRMPRYCQARGDTFACANIAVSTPTANPRPPWGPFRCQNGEMYWSNGSNAYSHVKTSGPTRRCATVDSAWVFTGEYRPETGGGRGGRDDTSSDCPNHGENQNNGCPDDNDYEPPVPAGNYGCVENEQGKWKCPGDAGYTRDRPVDTRANNGGNTRPGHGNFTCVGNGQTYWSNGSNAYRSPNETTEQPCPGVTFAFHIYRNGVHVQTI